MSSKSTTFLLGWLVGWQGNACLAGKSCPKGQQRIGCSGKLCGWQDNFTLPARGMRKGSVQNTALRESASREALTAMDNSMGSSGGITLVMIMVQFRNSLKRSLSGFCKALKHSVLFPDRPHEKCSCMLQLAMLWRDAD